jgi:hypothetical protein
MKGTLTIILLVLQTTLFAQWSSVNWIYSDEYIYNQIIKNIQLSDFNEYINQDFIPQFLIDKMNFCDRFPDILIKQSDLKYPNQNYLLFEIVRDGSISLDRKHVFKIKPKDLTKSIYLIAIDSSLKSGDYNKIKFISDNLITNTIYTDFDFEKDNYESYIEFIKLKKYYYHLDDFELLKKKRNYLLYKANSLTLNKIVGIRINKETFEIKIE